jgi:hypothetical protein
MGTVAKAPANTGGDFKPAPSGNHLAVCVGVIDLGTQFSKGYQGAEDTWKQQLMLRWELVDELRDDGTPFVISRRLTNSLHEKAGLRAILESWRGKPFTEGELAGFDVANVLGVPCRITVVHKPRQDGQGVYANVAGVAPLGKRDSIPEPTNIPLYFSLDDGRTPEQADLPEWLCVLIRQSRELAGTVPPPAKGDPSNVDGAEDEDEDKPKPRF